MREENARVAPIESLLILKHIEIFEAQGMCQLGVSRECHSQHSPLSGDSYRSRTSRSLAASILMVKGFCSVASPSPRSRLASASPDTKITFSSGREPRSESA